MKAEFEEKSYEQPLVNELALKRRLFAPGQVLENILGFDAALFTADPILWKSFSLEMPKWPKSMFYKYPNGVKVDNQWWQELERDIEYFPKFKFNCFIQAKRPEFMGSTAKEYSHWNKSYFRFDTFLSQQNALESLAAKTKGKAIVVYACPAFHKYCELWASVSSGKVVQQSNFCEVLKLKGHSRYSFTSPGNFGAAHSEPVSIESVQFERELESLRNLHLVDSNKLFLEDTASVMERASEDLGGLRSTFLSLSDSIFSQTDNELARSLAKIYAFQFVCNTHQLIGY